MPAIKCPITGESAIDLGPTTGAWKRVRCGAAGGDYEITGSAEEEVPALPRGAALRLVTWLVDQRRSGTAVPMVTTDIVQRISHSKQLRVSVRIERMYRMLEAEISSLDGGLTWRPSVYDTNAVHEQAEQTRARLRAWTESATNGEVETLVDFGASKGLIRAEDQLALTIDGLAHLEALNAAGSAYDQAFVAMWFGDEIVAAYTDGIEPAILSSGYVPMRIDRKEHTNKIDDEIVAEIRRSRFMIADFTCGTALDVSGKPFMIPRGGVYYEAGFAQGLGIPVIWTCRRDQIDHVHFDTRQFNHITWSTPEDLRESLANRIGAVLGDGPHKATEAAY